MSLVGTGTICCDFEEEKGRRCPATVVVPIQIMAELGSRGRVEAEFVPVVPSDWLSSLGDHYCPTHVAKLP